MESVTVKTHDLLDILKKNRDEHRGQFEEAIDGYKAECLEQLELRICQLKAGKRISMAFSMPEPQDMTSEFDNIINLLEICVDSEVEITTAEARGYLMNEWDWLARATMSNARYIGTGKSWSATS